MTAVAFTAVIFASPLTLSTAVRTRALSVRLYAVITRSHFRTAAVL